MLSAPMRSVALALITGAGSGIGRATALAFARRGLDLALVGRNEEALLSTRSEAQRIGVHAFVARADVSSSAEVQRAAEAILTGPGTPAVVVNNAGIVGRKVSVEETGDAEWDAVLGINLKGTFLVTRAFLPSMRALARGRIITIASISATLGTSGLAAYCASKWGLVGFSKALAEELRGSGLQAIAVLPGTVDTPMAKVGGFPPQMSPEDVARVVEFVSLDGPAAMNGSAVECFGP